MPRFSKIEDDELRSRTYLEIGDRCIYWGEYFINSGYEGDFNQLITNIKHPVNAPQNLKYYKNRDINRIGLTLANTFGQNLQKYTFVPIPPSECRTNPLYDDRLVRILRTCNGKVGPLDIRDMILQESDLDKAHYAEKGQRPGPQYYLDAWELDEDYCQNEPDKLVIFDDMLTRGAHFNAAKRLLLSRFTQCEIYGIFVTKAVDPPIDWNFEDD